jgi:hypothetical protein
MENYMKRILTAAFAILACLLSLPSVAEGIPVTPGKWEMKSTITNSMMQNPTVNTVTECLTESELTPDKMDQGMPPDCETTVTQLGDDTMRWTFDCQIQGTKMSGFWTAVSSGDSMTAEGEMSATFGERDMKMTMTYEGKHIGPCD